jgi:hypothetical protein
MSIQRPIPYRRRQFNGLPAGLVKLAQDPRVDEILDERGDDNGYWVYLKPGWINTWHETHSIHEMTQAECIKVFNDAVKPCTCEGCSVGVTID